MSHSPVTDFDPRLTPARPDLAAAYLKGKVKASTYVDGTLRQVVSSSGPLRHMPRHDALLDSELLHGERFTVYDEHEGWAWGKCALDGYVGYVPSADLGPPSEDATHRVTCTRTFVYPVADHKAPPLVALSMNAKVCISSPGSPFSETRVGPTQGFIFSDHVIPVSEIFHDYVGIAEQFLGAPYLWGGKQSVGLDCSGLVQIALERCGIAAPRDSDMQEAQLGVPLAPVTDLGLLRRGDLVFWTGHVGLMTDEKNLIHANISRMAVTIDPLETFATAVRPHVGPITSLKRLGA